MNKVIICLTGCILALTMPRAQDNSRQMPGISTLSADTARQVQSADSSKPAQDAPPVKDSAAQTAAPSMPLQDTTILPKDTTTRGKDTTLHINGVDIQVKGDNIHVDTVNEAKADSMAAAQNGNASSKVSPKDPAKDTAASQTASASSKEGSGQAKDTPDDDAGSRRGMDRRWFISPLLKGQFQDFAFLEKNRKGYLSDANTLPFLKRGNASFAASAYKNITGRLSISADIGLSFGHVTNDSKLISQTESKTYNLLNAALYFHLLSPAYHIQPYITAGINDIINDASYVSAPLGVGAKFTSRKIMVLGQITYGYAVSKNISNTTMYSLGIYIPIKSKKQKQLDAEDNSPYNKSGKDKKKDNDSAKGPIVNNIYITIKMDSLLKAKGLDGNGSGGSRKKGDGSEEGDDTADDGSGNGSGHAGGAGGRNAKKRNHLKNTLKVEDFDPEDYKVDTLNGEPVVRFVVYFEFNEYSLNSKAFTSVDKVIAHLQNKPDLYIEIKGYTDNVGTEQYNNFLSRRRAKMVLDYMNSRGVPAEFMKAKAYGSDDPVGDNSDPNQAWLNRRAEIIVHEKSNQ